MTQRASALAPYPQGYVVRPRRPARAIARRVPRRVGDESPRSSKERTAKTAEIQRSRLRTHRVGACAPRPLGAGGFAHQSNACGGGTPAVSATHTDATSARLQTRAIALRFSPPDGRHVSRRRRGQSIDGCWGDPGAPTDRSLAMCRGRAVLGQWEHSRSSW